MFWSILLYGSLWGIFEATFGYLLHLFPIRIGSFIWLPVACFFMNEIYKSTNKYSSIAYISIIAGVVKLINLLSPTRIDKVINPAISIILEGIAFMVIIYAVNKKKVKLNNFGKIAIFNTFWRSMYLGYLLFVPKWMFSQSALASREALFNFMIISNVKSGIGVYLYFKFADKIKIPVIKKVKPLIAIGGCAASIALTFCLR